MIRTFTKRSNYFKKRVDLRCKHDWAPPEGYDTGIRVYNRLAQGKVPLILPNRHLVKWYICGPTVYDSAHIGHASCYVRFDIIRRILEKFFDIKPIVALGITDIDDKIITKAIRYKEDFRSIAKKYELEFLKELGELHVLPPTFLTRVTDHVPEIVNFISRIIDKGQGFVELKPNPEVKLREGQEHESDFALWKAVKPDEPSWDSPWGKGRPGWHIECSAMASKLFGNSLDLHSGGMDLMFPHHQNEEAQSCSYHGHDQWVNYWIHAGQLDVNFEKMSKSLRNSVTISDFLKDHTSDHFRMFCFRTHYNDALHYGKEVFRHAELDCRKIMNFVADAEAYIKGNWNLGDVSESVLLQELEETKNQLNAALRDDFQTAKSFEILTTLINSTIRMLNVKPDTSSSRSPAAVAAVSNFISDVFDSFGFQFKTEKNTKANDHLVEQILNASVNFRSQIRNLALTVNDKPTKKNLLQACDLVRDDLKTVGVTIKDQASDKSSWTIT